MTKEKTKLADIKPALKEHCVIIGDDSIIVEDKSNTQHVVLPKKSEDILKFLNGENTIQQIISKLYVHNGEISFHTVITTVKLLNEAKILTEPIDLFHSLYEDKSPHEQKTSLLSRPLREFKLGSSLKWKYKSIPVFFIVVTITLASFLLSLTYLKNLNLNSYLSDSNGYQDALYIFVICSSLLITLKTTVQGLLLLFSTGIIYGPVVKWLPYAIGLGISENSIYTQNQKKIVITYAISSAILYLALTPFIIFFLSDIAATDDVLITAIILTLIELNPYRKSDFTKIFYYFYAQSQFKYVLPYLKGESLSHFWKDSGAKLSDELRYVLYSVLSILWAIVFLNFGLELLIENLPQLIYELQVGETKSKISSIVVLCAMFIGVFYLLIDLGHTFFKNIISPLIPKTKEKTQLNIIKNEHEIVKKVHSHLLFNQLNQDSIKAIIEKSSTKVIAAKGTLINEGDEAFDTFFILEGQLKVTIKDSSGFGKQIALIGENSVVGETAILTNSKRSASVIAVTETVYLKIPNSVLQGILNDSSKQTEADYLKNRIQLSHFISSAKIFKDFPLEVMNLFIKAGDLTYFPKDQLIVQEGELDKTFYLLLQGSVDILKNGKKINSLSQGDFFGEIALIANVPRSASVKTNEDCLFLFIEAKNFWEILSDNLELAMYIESVGHQRLERAK